MNSTFKSGFLKTLGIIFFGPVLWGQVNPDGKDYRITLTGDTVFTSFKEWKYNYPPEQLESVDGAVYKPSDIYGFSKDGILYRSHTSVIDISEIYYKNSEGKSNAFTQEKEKKLDTISVFMTLLVDGTANLLEWRYPNEKYYFFYADADTTLELKMVKQYYLSERSEVSYEVRKNRLYLNQLSYLMRDCLPPSLSSGTDYTYKDLNKVFVQYNRCKDPDYRHSIKKPRVPWELRAIAGINSVNLKFDGEEELIARSDLDFALKPVFGLGLKLPSFINRAFIHFDVLYTTTSGEGNYFTEDRFRTTEEFVNLKVNHLNLSLALLYEFPVYKDFTGYIKGGMATRIVISHEYSEVQIKREKQSSLVRIRGTDALESGVLTDLTLDGVTAAGVEWKNLALEYQYIISGFYMNFPRSEESVSRHMVLLSFTFLRF